MPVAVNCCVSPTGTEADDGETEIDCRTPMTFKVVEPTIEPCVADMVVNWPAVTPFARPDDVIVAAVGVEETHTTELVMSREEPSEKVPVAVNCSVLPVDKDGFTGVTPIAAKVTGVGFTVVTSEEELLAALLSPAVDTLAVLVTEGTAAAPTLTVRVMLLVSLFPASGPAFVQVTTCALAEQLHPVPVPLTKPSPVGSVSLTVIAPLVCVLPTLVTVRV